MLNWRARKPSTASVIPATTKTMKANIVLLVEISQMQSGTRNSLVIEMRLGMVIEWLRFRLCRLPNFEATDGITRRACQEGLGWDFGAGGRDWGARAMWSGNHRRVARQSTSRRCISDFGGRKSRPRGGPLAGTS